MTSNGDDNFGNLVEGEQITLTCETTYHGLWGPTQNWTDSAGFTIPTTDLSSGSTVEYSYIVSKILQQFPDSFSLLANMGDYT